MSDSPDIDIFHMRPEDLKDLKRDLLATVFNETHAQLLLYQQGKSLKISKTLKSRKLSKILSITDSKVATLSEEVLNDIKLDKELDTLRNIFKVAYDESLAKHRLAEENNYADLQQAIQHHNQNNNKIDKLTNELKENKLALKDLELLMTREKNEFTEKFEQKLQNVKDLRDQLDYAKRISRLEIRLVEKWEDNRLSQATIVGEQQERKLMQEILAIQQSITDEQRLICEIKSFRRNEFSKLQNEIVDWEEKFKREKNEMTTKNLRLTENIADIIKTHAKRREITEERKAFVAEYLRQKAEEQRLYEEQRYRIECAIRIQAWWRGVMVRRCLGPYRKKSKKGKKAKAKK